MEGAAGTWVSVATLAIVSLFAWLGKRDALLYDRKIQELESQNAMRTQQIQALMANDRKCQEDHEATRKELRECKEAHTSTDLRIAQIEAKLNLK